MALVDSAETEDIDCRGACFGTDEAPVLEKRSLRAETLLPGAAAVVAGRVAVAVRVVVDSEAGLALGMVLAEGVTVFVVEADEDLFVPALVAVVPVAAGLVGFAGDPATVGLAFGTADCLRSDAWVPNVPEGVVFGAEPDVWALGVAVELVAAANLFVPVVPIADGRLGPFAARVLVLVVPVGLLAAAVVVVGLRAPAVAAVPVVPVPLFGTDDPLAFFSFGEPVAAVPAVSSPERIDSSR